VRDLHGDLVSWSDNKNVFKGTAAYDPFGQVLSAAGEMATVPAQGALRFQADLTDAATGQVEMGARWYEPVLGRFSSMDPLFGELTDPASLNRFVYAGANPLTFTDPTGLKKADGGGGCRHCWDEVIAEINEDDPDQSAAVEVVPTDFTTPVIEAPAPMSLLRLQDTIGFCGGQGMFGQENSAKPFFSAGCGAWLNAFSLTSDGSFVFSPIPTEFRFDPDETASRERSEESYYGASRAREAIRNAIALPRELRGGSANVHVYIGYVEGKPMYTGITNDLARRQQQWGSQYDLRAVTDTPLTRGEARSVEEALIRRNPGFANKIHSISPKHVWYQQAVDWAEAWLRAQGL